MAHSSTSDPVVAWRAERLRDAGLAREPARRIAADRAYDLHAVLELVDRGCPAELALRILAPPRRAEHAVLSSAPASREGRAVSVTPISRQNAPPRQIGADAESRAWLQRLRTDGPERDQALGDLHELLLKAARFEVHRRSGAMPHLRGGDQDDLVQQSADDALLAILGKLDDFRGESRFTTWAYKFALLEAAVKLRRRAWQGREIPLETEHWGLIADQGSTPDLDAETHELMGAVQNAVEQDLTPHQREILVAITLNGVPIDVLAERLGTSRGAIYKTLHDARRKLRAVLTENGLPIETG